ncbi:hypothetical protein PMAYCL1PPCAC_06680, partial [Pristionchus mayeri]
LCIFAPGCRRVRGRAFRPSQQWTTFPLYSVPDVLLPSKMSTASGSSDPLGISLIEDELGDSHLSAIASLLLSPSQPEERDLRLLNQQCLAAFAKFPLDEKKPKTNNFLTVAGKTTRLSVPNKIEKRSSVSA